LIAGIANNNNGNLVINGGTYAATVADAEVQSNGTCGSCSITATDATFTSTDDTFYLAGGGTYRLTNCTVNGDTGVYMKSGSLTLDGTTIHATGTYHDPVANGNGASTTGDGIIMDAKEGYHGNMDLCLKGKTAITSDNGYAIHETYTDKTTTAVHNISIEDGYYSGGKAAISVSGYFTDARTAGTSSFVISGGYYTSDPSAYVVDGKAAVESDKAGYLFMIGEKSSTPAEVATAAPETENKVSANDGEHSPAEAALAETIVTAVKQAPSVSPDVVAAAANTVANNNTITEDEAKATLAKAKLSADNATVVVQTYLDIKVVDVQITTEGNTTTKTLTLDITPMYQLLVTNANNPKTATLNDQNSVPIGAPKELTITRPVVIQVNVGNALDTATIAFVIHYAKVGTRIYKGTVTNGILGFINPDGFSDFKVSTESPAVAEIGDTGYTSLQDAVDNAQNGETIKLTKDGQSAVVSRNVSFTVDTNGTTGNTITAGSNTKLSQSGNTYTFTYTAPAGSPVLYFETNGGSKLSSVTVASGSSVGLASYKPTRDGYAFTGWYADKALTKPVTSVTMAGDVTVYAGWEKADANPFRDVAANDYFYDAVLWALDKNITTGTSATAFSPAAACTRAEVVTFLWRAMGSPEPTLKTSPFTDVQNAGAYYYKAVLWATEKGIALGKGAGLFDPSGLVTRAEFAAFLYRAAGKPAASGTMPFTDVARTAYYYDAVVWAYSKGVTTGATGTTFAPNEHCLRAQVVAFLYRYLK
jgi:uncharacterized repeat protein (TIGR02543 family)